MDVWRDEGSDNLKAICDYIHEQGYSDMSQLEAQLPPVARPTMDRDRSLRHEGAATLQTPAKRSSSVAAARRSLKRTMRLSENFHRHPHIADLIRAQKQGPSTHTPLREGELATIAYNDTSTGTPPSTTAWQPRPKRTRSIVRNSTYTEIVVPDYGNGLYTPPSTLEATTASSSISPTSPSGAYTRFPFQPPSLENDTLPFPQSPSSSSLSSSRHSSVPSLSSTYSTEEAESPVLPSPEMPSHPFTTNNDDEKANQEANQISSSMF